MKRYILIAVFAFLYVTAFAQNIEIGISSYPGIWHNVSAEGFNGGGGIDIMYDHPLKKGHVRSGLEFRSIDWGNQVSIKAGYLASYIEKPRWSLSGLTSLGAGFALFRENPIFVWSAEYLPEFRWYSKKRFNASLSVGIRYSHAPKYIDYGRINQLIEIPVRIGLAFKMGDKDSENAD